MSERKDPVFTFSGFSPEQVNVLIEGLRELPYKKAADLIHGITHSAELQLKEYQESMKAGSTT